jgi:hypothetical protein
MTRSRARGFLAALFLGSLGWLLCVAPAGAALPDNRAWEQVSPVDKNGADISSTFGTPFTGVAVSADGNSTAYFSATPFSGTPNGLIPTFYRSSRGTGGWSTTPISATLPASPGALVIEYAERFDTSLSTMLLSSPFAYDPGDTDGPDAGHFPPDGWYDQYLLGGASPPTWVSHGTIGGDGHFESVFAGASDDLSHVVFQSQEKLLPGLSDLTGSGFYVYERSAGQTQLVNVNVAGDDVLDPYGATVGNGHFSGSEPNFDSGTAQNAVSDDGTRVFFESPAPGSGAPTPTQVFMRDTSSGTTTQVSSNTTDDALFAGASSDGSKVFFITSEALTGDDTDTDPDLYMYDTASDTLTRVSHGNDKTSDADVAGVAAIADNGAHVYFVAMNALSSSGGGTSGEPNIYRYDTATDNTAFVATLSTTSSFDPNVYSGNDQQHSAFTTPNGKTLVLVSDTNLTSYDAQGHREVYVYRTFPQGITCASCRTNGSAPNGDADLGFRSDVGFSFGWTKPMSDDGSRVFFDTTDTLVGDDVNGNAPNGGSLDVYEYADGVPSLISSGRSTFPTQLASVSPSGNDVFFYTRAALVPSDVDGGEIDLYDARVNGGFPPPPAPPAPCEGDACKGAPTAAPFLPAPSTTTASGGNVIPAPAKPKPTFSVTGITRTAARRAARTGRLVLLVRVTGSGRIRASAFARLAGRTRRVATATHTFGAAGSKHLTLRLSSAARAQLQRSGRLALRIDVTYSRGGKRTAHVTLRRSSR